LDLDVDTVLSAVGSLSLESSKVCFLSLLIFSLSFFRENKNKTKTKQNKKNKKLF